jgi:uncharacterized circularly permuted ATP-grasp superfamily protein/uncharacterized alpha-E superfamily protein
LIGDARDELLDDARRLKAPWRRMLGTLLGMGTAVLRERQADIDRAFAEDGVSAVLSSTGSANWRCDPIPFLFTEAEFAALTEALAQRAGLLELVLADVYGERRLLAEGLLPPALVYPSVHYLRPLRSVAPRRHIHLYAADVIRAPDGAWCVLADRTAEPAGLAYALENRRVMARVLPELFRAVDVSQLRPFFDTWQDALQRLAPAGAGNPGVALLTRGHADPRWFEHVMLARELNAALVEAGDLTVRDGALWVKTLAGLQPIHVLLRRQDGSSVDPLELSGVTAQGIPGLLCAMRAGAVQVLNGPGAGFAEAPALGAFLPMIATRLLGEALAIPGHDRLWLGDAASRAIVEKAFAAYLIRSAVDAEAPVRAVSVMDEATRQALRAEIAQTPWAFCASKPARPSFAPCSGEGDTLEPRSLVVRLFLVFDGSHWRPLQGGLARVLEEADVQAGRLPTDALSKDVWVLQEEGTDIYGPGNMRVPALSIRRTPGDLPSRVADNFFWLGRYLERLENAGRLTRATISRLARGALLPRDIPDFAALAACLADAGIVGEDYSVAAGPGLLADMLRRAMVRDDGSFARLENRIEGLADTLRDRLSGEMHAMIGHDLRRLAEARAALRPNKAAMVPAPMSGPMLDFASQVLAFCATVAGYAAENMVRGGGRLFLDLGRRIERAQAVARQLAHALDRPPARLESGLSMALELCDSALTYRSRYLTVLQPALVIDLVVADEGNPRGLGYQLATARTVLAVLGGADDAPLAAALDGAIAETKQMVAELVAADDQAPLAAALAPRLLAVEAQVAAVSNQVSRQYFALLPAIRTEGLVLPDTADANAR